MDKRITISIISFLSIIMLVSLVFNIRTSSQNKSLAKSNAQLGQRLNEVEKEIAELEGVKQGKVMSEKNWECKWNCSNYLIQKDQLNQTNFNNLCHEDCRRELDRIALEIRTNPQIDLENQYEINFFRNYIEEDKPATYKLINQDLGSVTGNEKYNAIFARHVYEAANVGFRVVPFPYREENQQIVEVENLEDLFFNKNGEEINCEAETLNQELCQVLQKYESNDRAEGMLLDCASKHCNFLEAIRTRNSKRCSYINQFTAHASDDEWISLCQGMIEENS